MTKKIDVSYNLWTRVKAMRLPDIAFAALICTYVSLCFGFSPVYGAINSDNVIPVFISVFKWTPFFWGTDRFGSVIPAIFAWLPIYSLNMIAQMSICIFLLLLSYCVLSKTLFGGHDDKTSVLTVLLFYFCFHDKFVSIYGNGLSYAQSLGFLSLAILSTSYAASSASLKKSVLVCLSLLFLLVSLWISFNIILLVFAILALIFVDERLSWKFRAWAFQAAVLSFALVAYVVFIGSGQETHNYAFFVPDALGASLIATTKSAFAYFFETTAHRILLVGGLISVVVSLLLGQKRRIAVRILFLTSFYLVEAIVASSNSWVAKNGFHPRYLTVSMTLIMFFLCHNTGFVLARLTNLQLRAIAICIILLCLNFPSYTSAFKSMVANDEAQANELIALDCDLYAGHYWSVWKAAFVANVLRQRLDLPGLTFGLSDRSNVALAYVKGRVPDQGVVVCVQNLADRGGENYYFETLDMELQFLMQLQSVTSLALARIGNRSFPVDEKTYSQRMQDKLNTMTRSRP